MKKDRASLQLQVHAIQTLLAAGFLRDSGLINEMLTAADKLHYDLIQSVHSQFTDGAINGYEYTNYVASMYAEAQILDRLIYGERVPHEGCGDCSVNAFCPEAQAA